jgi:7,8-didemethyl-8-hydroxy-5-deazariboflavin synthase CofG subunit
MGSNQQTIKYALSKSIAHEFITKDEAISLSKDINKNIEKLCVAASSIRDKGKGNKITFSPKVFIPLTQLCRDYCGYCTFRKDPKDVKSLYMDPEEILKVVKKGEKAGCTEALFTLGERPELRFEEAKTWLNERGYKTTLEYVTDMCKLVINNSTLLPHANPGTMSKNELREIKKYNASVGLMLESTSKLLYQPGGPHEFAPSKRPIARIKTMQNAGELNIPFTTGLLIGIGETLEDRIESLFEILELQKTYGNIQEVIIQNFKSKPNTPMSNSDDAETIDMLWTISMARLILGSNMNIQAPPNLSSDNFEIYLDAGINDWGGVSPITIDYVNPESPWPTLNSLKTKTEAKGFKLTPRLPVYPEYFIDTNKYLPEYIIEHIRKISDKSGYVKKGIDKYVSN